MEENHQTSHAADAPGPAEQPVLARDPAEDALKKRRAALIDAAAGQESRPRPEGTARFPGRKEDRGNGRGRHRRRGFGHGTSIRLIVILVLLIVLVAAVMALYAELKKGLASPVSGLGVAMPASIQEMLPDEKMGYNKIDFTNAILGESRERQELIVLEQDVEVTTQVSQALANIALFAKTKTLISHGTGVYTVSFLNIGEDSVDVDQERQLVTLTIPHTTLQYIDFDVTNTESGETEKALLAIGEIKLTAEQDLELKTAIHASMEEKLTTPAMFTKADEAALGKVSEVFAPLIRAVSPDYVLKIVMEEA